MSKPTFLSKIIKSMVMIFYPFIFPDIYEMVRFHPFNTKDEVHIGFFQVSEFL
ncbi:hypothetical protein MCHI_003206 [Candidatus Magnetoovum chiemensis]|nr:hypothetical protein MCHI_003206 [Candidatus Magnetoovum chiemensis]